MAHRPNLATACVYTAQEPRMIFTLLNNWKKDVKTLLGYLTVSAEPVYLRVETAEVSRLNTNLLACRT